MRIRSVVSIDIFNSLKIINNSTKNYTIPSLVFKEEKEKGIKEIRANTFLDKSNLFKKVLFPKLPSSTSINLKRYKEKD